MSDRDLPEVLAGDHSDELPDLRGEVGALMRSIDWSRTSLGPMPAWPRSLKTMIGVMLGSRFPMMLGWGDDLLQFYNDAYIPVLGVKHPASLGAPVREVWSEIWETVGPLMHSVLAGGPALWREHQLLFINSRGFNQETFHTFSQSPITNDDGRVGGVLLTVQETTEQVQGARQLEVLHSLAEGTACATSAKEACQLAASALTTDDADVPFAIIYLLDEAGAVATPVASAPASLAAAQTSIILPPKASLDAAQPYRAALDSGRATILSDLPARFGPIPGGRYGAPAERAVVLPLARSPAETQHGFVVIGLSQWREASEQYLTFTSLVASQLASAIARARSAEEERRRADAIAELDRAKTLFFSNVSHELRTPLTLILGPTTDALLSPQRRLEGATLEALHRNALRLQKLVGALLDFARIEAGRELVDLSMLTADVASAFTSAMRDAGLAYDVTCEKLPLVYVDPDHWEKITLNLISNALKFTLKGKVRVSLRAASDDEIELGVQDTGTGIAPDELPRIFDRFHRVRGAQARTLEGSGIGLALVHELCRLHGGSVTVKSELGVGSTFTVALPMVRADAGAHHRKRSGRARDVATPFIAEAKRWIPAAATDELLPAVSGGLILVVDDNADMRDYLQRVLSAHWEVETATDGVAALAAIARRRPDVVLSDVMMPNLDGFGLLSALRKSESTAELPVILLSARAGEESRIEGLQTGADDYLVKPFSARELIARVQVHLTLADLRRRLLERAVEARNAAEAATRAKDEFLAMLGHELRNPMSPIVLAVQLLRVRGRDDPELDIIERQVRQLERLVDDLLDVSRIARGKIQLQRERVSIVDVLARAIETARPSLGDRDHALSVDAAEPLPVDGDPARLEQVFANLLTNASKYSDVGRPIHIVARAVDGFAEVRVEDQGIGIRPELLERVFDLFMQQPQSLDRSAGGLGLGLAIVKNLVTSHGGYVRAESEGPGKGSRFIVGLPSASGASGASGAPASDGSPDAGVEAPPPAQTMRKILVVDDNEDGAAMLAGIISGMGYEVWVAHDGPGALALVRHLHPDIAVLDIGLPGMDGYELAARLRQLPDGREIRLVAITGYGQARDRETSARAGFSDHLVKPADIERLRQILAAGEPGSPSGPR
jgi:signal transduction histidine kinase